MEEDRKERNAYATMSCVVAKRDLSLEVLFLYDWFIRIFTSRISHSSGSKNRTSHNSYSREDQLGVSLLTIEQLETKEMQQKIQDKVQQG